MNKEIESLFQERCRRLVQQEIMLCLSGLVVELMKKDCEGFMDRYPDLVSGYIENDDGEEEYIEIFEYWAVSEWLADKLAEEGERVDKDFYGLNIWGRTCTGQAIAMDHVIRTITTQSGYCSYLK